MGTKRTGARAPELPDEETFRQARLLAFTIAVFAEWASDGEGPTIGHSAGLHDDPPRVARALRRFLHLYERSDLKRLDDSRMHAMDVSTHYRPLVALLTSLVTELRHRRATLDQTTEGAALVDAILADWLPPAPHTGWTWHTDPGDIDGIVLPYPPRDRAQAGGWFMLPLDEWRAELRIALLEVDAALYGDAAARERNRWRGSTGKVRIAEAVLDMVARKIGSTREAVRKSLDERGRRERERGARSGAPSDGKRARKAANKARPPR